MKEASDSSTCCNTKIAWRQMPGNSVYQNDQTPTDDADQAKEMYELSVEEREKVFDDMHGVAKAQEETEKFVKEKIAQLDSALSKLPRNRRKAFDRAVFYKPSIQKDKAFKLMFLRADCYDGSKAAERITLHFDKKLSLFGVSKLTKKITLEDLTEEERQILNKESLCICAHKDATGRPIWVFDYSRQDSENFSSKGFLDSIVSILVVVAM